MSSGSSWKQLVDGVRHRADVRLAHHDAPARAQHAHRLGEEARRRRQVVEHVEQHQRAQARRPRTAARSALASPSCHGARTTSVSSRSGMNSRAKPGPDPSSTQRAQRRRRQLARDARVPARRRAPAAARFAAHARRCSSNRSSVRRSAARPTRPSTARHTNLSLRAAIADMRSNSSRASSAGCWSRRRCGRGNAPESPRSSGSAARRRRSDRSRRTDRSRRSTSAPAAMRS